jgi:arginase
LAVKIVRQVKSVALLGAPTSAASLKPGNERAPGALRAAGLVARLTEAGFSVTDYGDCATRISQPDDEHPRARGASQVLTTLEELRPKVEVAVKSGALPIVLGGDDSIVLATVAGVRRYYRDVSLIYVDRDAGLNEPATTPTGCIDGMVISHVLGRGAPELVRFWGEPPLVREPDVVLFGMDRLDEPEQRFLARSPLQRFLFSDISRTGISTAAKQAFDHAHGRRNEFVLHIDLDVIASEDFAASNLSAPGGLRLADLREALAMWVREPKLAAIEISGYNPALDADSSAAQRVIDLLVDILKPRLEPPASETPAPATPSAETVAPANSAAPAAPVAETSTAAVPPAANTFESSAVDLNQPAIDFVAEPDEPPSDPSIEAPSDPSIEPADDPFEEPRVDPSNEPPNETTDIPPEDFPIE